MEQLGIEPVLLIAQIVNFSVIVFVLSKLLYKPILDMLDKRRTEIEKGLKLSEKMQAEEEKFNERKAKLLEAAKADARRIIEEAKKFAKEKEKEIMDEAQKEAASVIERGRAEVREIHENLKKDIQKEAVDLAVAMTKRLTEKVLTANDQHKLISVQLKQLEKVK